jgi:hypothetical protein
MTSEEQRSCPMGKPVCEVRCAWNIGGVCSEVRKLEKLVEICEYLKEIADKPVRRL